MDELRLLVAEKRRKDRLQHLNNFQKTGRVVSLAPDVGSAPFDHLHSTSQAEPNATGFQPEGRQKARRVMDNFLLAIEVLAVIGLMLVIYSGIQMLQDLNAQFARSLVSPTLTPTSFMAPVVLPSGHTSPSSPGGARPNHEEVPPQLRRVYQTQSKLPSPTPGVEHAIRIQISAINLDAPIVQGDGWEELKQGVAQHIGSANPGQAGNLVLSAHNDVFGELFRHLDWLESGDEIIVYTHENSYSYIVSNTQIVAPTAVEVMAPTSEPTVTLISCYPYLVDNQRIVVQASLQENNE
jgi:sortase A